MWKIDTEMSSRLVSEGQWSLINKLNFRPSSLSNKNDEKFKYNGHYEWLFYSMYDVRRISTFWSMKIKIYHFDVMLMMHDHTHCYYTIKPFVLNI